jgi:SSS family solute:Na+ symporter
MSSSVAALLLVLVLGYTALLLVVARRGHRPERSTEFLDGGRRFSGRQVFMLVSALWCSSIFVVEMETGYLYGLSALWFGFATALMALVSGYLVPTFRRLGYLTSSGVIGVRFGRAARVTSGLVVGLTFPIFAMSNVLGAAGFLDRVVGWPLPVTLLVAEAVILGYVFVGGMRALARAQVINLVVMAVGMLVALGWAAHAVSLAQVRDALPARMLTPGGAGAGLILTWIFASLLNVVNAQAEFQILTAARDVRAARRGLHAAVAFTAVFTVAAVAVGMAARAVAAPHQLGVIAIPALFASAPLLILAVVCVAIWAAALSWAAPLMLSGAASLGVDVLRPLVGQVRGWSTRPVSHYVRVALPVQALLVVAFALLRPADLAWWRILGQTVRTGALFATTLAVLALPTVGRRTAVASMAAGTVGGLGWNVLTGFSVDRFALDVNPMWVGATAGLLVLAGGSLLATPNWRRTLRQPPAVVALVVAASVGVGLVQLDRPARALGLTGPAMLLAAAALVVVAWIAERSSGAPAVVAAPTATSGVR